MKLDLDAQGYVRGYTDSGEATGVDYDGVVPDDFAETCRDYRYQDGALLLDAERAAQRAASKAEFAEWEALLSWFRWYDNQCMQYQRAQRQQTPFDRDIAALDEQAAVSQARIRALEQKYGGRMQDGEEAN